MANSTFSGPVRSESGFQSVSKNTTTGAFSTTAAFGTGSSLMTPGTGISTGTGTVCVSSVDKSGDLIITTIFVDLTGLNCGGTAADIIGVDGAANSHIGQITAAVNGTIVGGKIVCHEAPTTGDPDIDIYSADEATGAEDAAITTLTNDTKLVDSGDLTLGSLDVFTAFPAADQYLYLVCGTATAGTYDAGKLEITLYGTAS